MEDLSVDIELGAHKPVGAHDAPEDIFVDAAGSIGDEVVAVAEGGDRWVEGQVRSRVDSVERDRIQRGIENAHIDIRVAGSRLEEGDRDVYVGQVGDCRRCLIPEAEPTDCGLAADLVAGGVVSLPDDGQARGVVHEAVVLPVALSAFVTRSIASFRRMSRSWTLDPTKAL